MVFEVFTAVKIKIVIYCVITWRSSAVKMKATGSSETLVNTCGSRLCRNPDDDDPCFERRNPQITAFAVMCGWRWPAGVTNLKLFF